MQTLGNCIVAFDFIGFLFMSSFETVCQKKVQNVNCPASRETGEHGTANLKRFAFNFPLYSESLLHPVYSLQHKYVSFPEHPENKEETIYPLGSCISSSDL